MSYFRPGKFIDFHVHLFPDEIAPKAIGRFVEMYGIKPKSDGTVSGTLACMDKVGIHACVPQNVATKPSQVRDINDWAASIRSERIIPFGCMHPKYDRIKEEIDRLVDLGFPGVKLQPDWQKFYPDDEKVFPIYQAAEGRLAVLFHVDRKKRGTGEERATAARVLAVHRKFPGLTIIAAHMGGYQCWVKSEESLLGEDVFLDMAHCPPDQLSDDEMVRLIRKHGTNKILFASDLPFDDPKTTAERLSNMPLADDEKEDIAWRNAARILQLGK